MNTMTTKRTSLKLGLLAPLALTGLAIAPHAWADNILLAQTTLVSGNESTVDSFVAPTAGTVSVSIESLNWLPSTLGGLNALSFSATSANQVLGSWNSSGTGLLGGTANFQIAGGTYFAHIMASASGTIDMGLYSLMMTFTPNGTPTVPLPASGWLLLTGMFVLAGLVRAARPLELTGTAGA